MLQSGPQYHSNTVSQNCGSQDACAVTRLMNYTECAPRISKEKQSCPDILHAGAWGERMYSSYSFLISALDGVSGQRYVPAALCPGERTSGTDCTGGWVRPEYHIIILSLKYRLC
jgi:hypothetical protein